MINHDHISGIIRATASQPELFDEIVERFHQSSLERLASIREHPDLENVCFQVHALKGAAGSIGAEGLRKFTANVEKKIEQGSSVTPFLADIEQRLESALDAISKVNHELRFSIAQSSAEEMAPTPTKPSA